MKMQKKQFRIGELAKRLNVERFVIRFWEKEFNLKPSRSDGGQRFYEEKDFQRFRQIKELLYNQGFTINGARQQLKQPNGSHVLASQKTTMEKEKSTTTPIGLHPRIIELRERLVQLRKLL